MQIQLIQSRIYTIRGQKVMLDFDLAELYETETRTLKQAVRRNQERFPDDFMFELTKEEFEHLTSQIVITSNHGGRRHLPFAFTEQGVAMLSGVLKSKKAANKYCDYACICGGQTIRTELCGTLTKDY